MKRILITFLLLSLAASFARADVFMVEDIRINVLQRVSAGSVFAAMPVSAGDLIDDETVKETSPIPHR